MANLKMPAKPKTREEQRRVTAEWLSRNIPIVDPIDPVPTGPSKSTRQNRAKKTTAKKK